MILVFQRTGQKRYAVFARRSPLPDLEMNPAPGYDTLMPHDLLHLVVEAQLGLKRGIFGQLAAGGDAGTFHPIPHAGENTRAAARVRNRIKSKGKSLLREGRDDSEQSERAAYICWYEWLARSKARDQLKVSKPMAQTASQLRGVARAKKDHTFSEQKMAEICRHLDELSAHWSNLEVGESMSIHWPDLTVSTSPSWTVDKE